MWGGVVLSSLSSRRRAWVILGVVGVSRVTVMALVV